MNTADKSSGELQLELIALKQENESLKKLIAENSQRENQIDNGLRVFEERFEIIMEAANFAWWEINIPTGAVYFSKRKTDILGYPKEEFNHYKDFMAAVHPDDYEAAMLAMNDHIAGVKDNYECIYRIKTKEGEYKRFHDIGKITSRDSEGNPLIISGIVIDLSNKFTQEEIRKETEINFKLMFQGHKSIMLLIDPISKDIIDANQAASDFYLYSIPELKKMSITQINALDSDQVINEMNKAKNGEKILFVFPHKLANGEIKFVEVHSSEIALNNKHLLFSIINDITERKKIEEELKIKEEYLIKGEEIGKYGHWVLFLDDNIMTSSDGASKIYGLDKNENSLVQAQRMVLPEYRAMLDGLMMDTIKKGLPYEAEFKIKRESDGKIIDISSKAEYNSQKNILFGTIQDITEQKRIQETLQESEKQLSSILNEMSVGVLLQGAQSEILLCNLRALELLGLTKEQLLGKSSFDPDWNVIHEDGSPFPGDTHPVPQAIRTKQAIRGVIMGVFHPLKQERNWLLVDAIPQLNDDGSVKQVICTFIDISKRKKAEEELNNYFTNALDLFCIADSDGNFIKLNNEWENCLGYTVEELKGKKFFDFIHPDDLPKTIEAVKSLEAHNAILNFTNRYQTKTGEYRIIEWRSTPHDKYIYAAARDITDRIKLEDELIHNEKFLRMLTNNLPSMVGYWTKDLVCKFANNKYLEWYGKSGEDITNISLPDLLGEELFNKNKQYIDRAFYGEIVSFERTMTKTDKTKGYTWAHYIPDIKDGLVEGFYVLISDITEIKEAQFELERLNANLNELNATKDKFFSIIAHDLRNPLGNFKEVTKLLAESYNDFSELERIEFLNLMKDSSNNVYLLLENLLEWSRSQKGSIQFNPSEMNLKLVSHEVIKILKSIAEKKSIRIENAIPAIITIRADANMLQAILRNLISNAIKFTRENGKIILNAEVNDCICKFSVSDNGVGMSKETINKLFRIDSTISSKGTNKESGTGLGLILCKEFVEKHGGKIWVESEEGKGTTFYFTLQN